MKKCIKFKYFKKNLTNKSIILEKVKNKSNKENNK